MSSSGPLLEGVFAINKPPAISSAQVIRDVQQHFDPSNLFRPWLENEQRKRDAESHNQRNKRKWRGKRQTSVKMGHGGTLDPMATGVLILGIGSGTKQLNYFTKECTKTYETVVLFGAATDTYDTEGKILGRKPYEHVTRNIVEEALKKFEGKGMQKPPIFSALRVQGKRAYEYAREGKELPVEIAERPVDVSALEVTEWFEGGSHQWHWPERESEKAEKDFARKAMRLDGAVGDTDEDAAASIAKPARDEESCVEPLQKRVETRQPVVSIEDKQEAPIIDTLTDAEQEDGKDATQGQQTIDAEPPAEKTTLLMDRVDDNLEKATTGQPPCSAPACRIRMTVTSGFYVRSLCHDLGAAVGSLGIMAALVRTRQGEFELEKNVLWYDELRQGEDVWGPKVQNLLESWTDKKNNKA